MATKPSFQAAAAASLNWLGVKFIDDGVIGGEGVAFFCRAANVAATCSCRRVGVAFAAFCSPFEVADWGEFARELRGADGEDDVLLVAVATTVTVGGDEVASAPAELN